MIRSPIPLALLPALLLGVTAASAASADPQPLVTWEAVPRLAAEQFAARRGRAAVVEHGGLQTAQRRVGGRWDALWVTAEPGVGVARRDRGAADSFVGVGARLELADRRSLLQSQLRSHASSVLARSDAERFDYRLEASRAWLSWCGHAVVAAHLAEDIATYEAMLAPFDQAVARGGLTRLDQADLHAELARLRAELIATRSQADQGAAVVRSLLGAEPTLSDPEPWTRPTVFDGWTRAAEALERHPALLARAASADVARREAAAAELNPLRLDFGLLAHLEDSGFLWAAPTLSLEIPLDNPGRADAEVARARAAREVTSGQAELEELRLALRARQGRTEALRRQWQGLDDALLAPLSERLALVEAALARGAARGIRLVDAWRDLHEAKHARLATAIALTVDAAEASRFADLLAAGDSP